MSSSVDPKALSDYRERKLIRTQVHPELPLCIHNYTEICQFTKAWDDMTKLCRGLITDDQGAIVARSFRKFFNHGEDSDDHVPTSDFVVQDKMDGSLIMIFWYAGWFTASRGSFVSTQAVKAKAMIKEKYSLDAFDTNFTYVFEIIYPENKIVLDYADQESLVFLACFDKRGNEQFNQQGAVREGGFEIVKQHPFDDYSTIKDLNWADAEGFVVRFSNGHRVKIKFQNYVDLHRVVTNLTPKTVWTMFGKQDTLDICLETIPDEWHTWFKTLWNTYNEKYYGLKTEVILAYGKIDQESLSRRDFALTIIDHPYKKFFFLLKDGKRDIHELLCNALEPSILTMKSDLKNPSSIVHKRPTTSTTPPELVIMVGVSGSGKSTLAEDMIRKSHRHVIVSRDALRKSLYSYVDADMQHYYTHPLLSVREELVTKVQADMIRTLLKNGQSVIVDDTNCSLSTINRIMALGTGHVTFQVMNTDIDEAIRCDAKRDHTVGEAVIRKQRAKLDELKKNFNFKVDVDDARDSIHSPDGVPDCFIFDVDGTLALNTSGRSYYDWASVTEDSICPAVRDCAIALHEAGYTIIICSGRDDCCLRDTADWLRSYYVPFREMHFRKTGDMRKDSVVKEEMWRQIAQTYRIKGMFDDRQSVVQHARGLGLQVFQVAENLA